MSQAGERGNKSVVAVVVVVVAAVVVRGQSVQARP